MHTLAIHSFKGGVGKSTCAVNLAYVAAQEHWTTLLWDLDPQGASSWMLRVEAADFTVKKVLQGKQALGKWIVPTVFPKLHVLPASFSLRDVDLALSKLGNSNRSPLVEFVAALSERYEVLILDCPPSFSALSEAVFEVASQILVPVTPSSLSQQTFAQTRAFFKSEKIKAKRLRPVLSMVDRRIKRHREALISPDPIFKRPFKTIIPYSPHIARMAEMRQPVGVYAPNAKASVAFLSLWQEIRQQWSASDSD